MGSPWLTIIGIGEDGRAGLSPAALAALDRADFVIGGARHIALAAPLSAQTQIWPSPFADGYPMILPAAASLATRSSLAVSASRPVIASRRGLAPAAMSSALAWRAMRRAPQ